MEPERRSPGGVPVSIWIRRGAALLALGLLIALISLNWSPVDLWFLGTIQAPLSLILGAVSLLSAGVGAGFAWWWQRRRGRAAPPAA